MNYQWEIEKPITVSNSGVVVSQHILASKAGAEVLEEGGNAVDAAITAALTLGVVEPWLSGIGGGGFLLYYNGEQRKSWGIDFNMVTPSRLDPKRYTLVNGHDHGLFNWPAVEEDMNLKGFHAICVPGAVDGLGRSLERFGTIPWSRSLEPAIRHAREGMLVDWYTTLSIATAAAEIAEFKATAERFLPGGWPPVAALGNEGMRLSLDPLADTLTQLAQYGYRDFYDGDIASAILDDLQAGGNNLVAEDLRSYRADVVEPLKGEMAGAKIYAMPELSGGPSYVEVVNGLNKDLQAGSAPDAHAYATMAATIQDAYGRRLTTHGQGSAGESCTTHVSVVDRWGNVASLTNTLLARFGSKVTLPQTGILMNNGLMWFDPVPGRPNSIRSKAKPLANMCPVVIARGDKYRAALGAAGGRRIMPALAQLTTFLLHYRMGLRTATRQPRLDASQRTVILDSRLPEEVRQHLAEKFDVKTVTNTVYPPQFSIPSIAVWEQGEIKGAAYSHGPWQGTVAP